MKHDIIFIADEPWEFTWRRRHHIAWRLADNHRVFFIEPPDPNNREMVRVMQRKDNLYTVSLRKLFPDAIIRAKLDISWLNQLIARKMLRDSLKSFDLDRPILWVNFSTFQYDYYGLFNEKLIIADWYDKFTAPTWENVPRKYINFVKRREDVLLRRADIVFAVSTPLVSELAIRNAHVYRIPNGVDMESFSQGIDADALAGIGRPRIGFLGMLHYKVDFDLLNYIATYHPEWNIILIGKKNIRVENDKKLFDLLRQKKNVHIVGEISREMIPVYLDAIDIGIVPLKKIEMNRFANYLKIWEYLAAGKPIVAIDQGASSDCDHLINKVNTYDEFVGAIEKILANKESSEKVAARKDFARENSWGKRVEKMMEIIEAKIKG